MKSGPIPTVQKQTRQQKLHIFFDVRGHLMGITVKTSIAPILAMSLLHFVFAQFGRTLNAWACVYTAYSMGYAKGYSSLCS